jgi:flavin reductase (DIM6/NTAB) family NADH-FMN oxidoreductase RutF
MPTPERFRDLMAAWPTGVSVVTSAASGRPIGCTVTALASVSAQPPLLLVSLADTGRTLAAVRRHHRFGVCVLSGAQRHLGRAFAGGDPAQRFARVAYDWVAGVPVLRDAATAVVCAVSELIPVADHVLVVGRPLWQARNPAASPAIWFQRSYWDLCRPGRPTGHD